MNKKELVSEVARQLYQFNWENKKYNVSDEFEVDGKRYSIKNEVYAWMKRRGFTSLVEMIDDRKSK